MDDQSKYHIISVEVKNPLGIHMRPASKLVETAIRYPHEILIYRPAGQGMSKKECKTNAKSMIEILCLAATRGTRLDVYIEKGKPGYEGAAKAIKELFDSGFGELDSGDRPCSKEKCTEANAPEDGSAYQIMQSAQA
ncbi:MAG: HPr family phosphocarrier protein [Candidatus Aenigmatarchaeota archaeon]